MTGLERDASPLPAEPDPALVLTRRLRAGALIGLVALVAFGAADLHAGRASLRQVLVVKTIQLVAVVAALAATRRKRSWTSVRRFALTFVATMLATAAIASAARGDPLTLPLVLSLSVMAAAALVPWGLFYQFGLVAVAFGAALVPFAALTTIGSAPPFPGLALLLTFATSLYVAVETERHRRVRDRAAQAVRESEGRFRALAETAPVLIWMSDASGGVVYLNPEWEEVLGHPVEPAAAETMWRDVHPDDRETLRQRIAEGTGAQRPWECEYRIRAADGVYRWVLMRGVPRRTGTGAFAGYVGSAIDVTARKEEAEAVIAARNAALEVARVKADFLATMSHEIRTPMHGVFGMTELALDARDDEERRLFLERARGCARTLMDLLDDVLDFSRIEAGKLEVVDAAFEPRHVLRDVTDAVEVAAARKGLTLDVTVDTTVPSVLRGDAKRLRQILVNLVGNAVKFTEQGRVEVRLEHATGTTDTAVVLLRCTVRDTGIGIPREHLGHIFEAFRQVDTPIARAFGGTGLGLAITRSLVELLGGTIEVESAAGSGSTFSVTLPFRVGPAPALEAAGAAAARARS